MNPLIHGKQDLKHIVSVEVINDTAEIFLQDKIGNIETVYVPNEYWILSNQRHGKHWLKLHGDLHYNYAKKFKEVHQYYGEKKRLKKQNADLFTISDPKESFLVKNGYTYFHDLQPKDITILSFDIETTGLKHDDNSKILIISNTYRKAGQVTRKLFTYDEYESQGDLLLAWCDWVREIDPSLIVGHNIYTYDLPYIQYIADKEWVELSIGRNGSPVQFFNYESYKRIDGSRKQAYHKCRIYGREVIDTMFLAINYDIGKKYESYALKKIIAHEGLEVKDRQFYDAASIRFNYTNKVEWEKIKRYALHDADDSLALFDLMSPAFFYLNQTVPKSFQGIVESASGSQINSMMIRAYINDKHSLPKPSLTYDFEGATSFGIPGIYRNCFKVDVASLYPNIMIQYEVYNEQKDPKAYMYEMVKVFTEERLKNKKLAKETGQQYYDDLQNAQKIIINSFYGFLAAEGLLFNSPKDAEFVTRMGREILKTSLDWATSKGFKIANADTDSIMFNDADSLSMSDEYRKELLNNLNSLYPELIKFADDGYFKTVIVLKAKNYILFDGKKIKTKGSSLRDSKKEKALKEFLNKIIETIIEGRANYKDIYDTYAREATNIIDMSRWSSKKTISSKVLKNERTNEAKIRNAIQGREIVEGDKVFMYYKEDKSLSISDTFDGSYDKTKMLEKLYKTSLTFANVIPKETFPNYKLKRNKKALEEILNEKSS